MKSFDLGNTLYEECNKFGFSSDIREIFVSLKQNTLVVNAIHNKTNEFQNTQNNLLYDLILLTYRKEKKFFFPIFKYSINEMIFDATLPRLCLNLHSNFSPLTSILIKKNCEFVVVSDYPNTIRRVAFNSGVRTGNIKIISRDETCLLNTKKFLEKNYVVSSTIDFRRNLPGKYNLLSDSMLKLALHMRSATLFGLNFVNDLGELVYVTMNINLDDNLEKIKQDLISFIATHKKNSQFEFDKFDYIEQKNSLSKYLKSLKER